MKLLLSISLCLVVLNQLCTASSGIIVKDKRFAIFELIDTKLNEYMAAHIEEYIKSWSEFNETLASGNELELYNSEDYRRLSQAMNEYTEAWKKLKADIPNCDLALKLKEKMRNVLQWKTTDKFKDFDIFDIVSEKLLNRSGEILSPIVNELFAQLPAKIDSFKVDVDVCDGRKYREYLFFCDKFLEANTIWVKYESLRILVDLYIRFPKTTITEHCEWKVYHPLELFDPVMRFNWRNYMPQTDAENETSYQFSRSSLRFYKTCRHTYPQTY